jgi:hypothetical protein
MGRKQDKVFNNGKIVMNTWVILKIIKSPALAPYSIQMDVNSLENLSMENSMVMVNRFGQMELNTKVTS